LEGVTGLAWWAYLLAVVAEGVKIYTNLPCKIANFLPGMVMVLIRNLRYPG